MRDRSKLIYLGAIVFFLFGGWTVFTIVNGANLPGEDECWNRGGVPALAPSKKHIVCIDQTALR